MIQKLKNQLLNRLDHLNPRERKLVLGGAAFGVFAIVWMVLIEPPLLTLKQASQTVGGKQEQASRVLQAAAELDALRGARSRVVIQQGEIEPRLKQMLAEEGLESMATLATTEEGEYRITFEKASAASFLKWLGKADAITSVKVQAGQLEKIDAGLLSGTVTLLPNATKGAGTP